MSILSKPYFHNEKAAFQHLEGILWAKGVVCPKCGTVDRAGKLEGVKGKNGKVRLGLWKCYECRKQFTVRVGTVFRECPYPAAQVLTGGAPHGVQQEGHFGASAAPHP